jgi:hypothetical protein
MAKKGFLIVVLAAIVAGGIFAVPETGGLDLSIFDVPSFNPVLSGYFAQTLANSLSTRLDYMDNNLEFRTLKPQYTGQSDLNAFQMNYVAAFKVWLTKQDSLIKVAIPLYAGGIYTSNTTADSVQTSEYFLGSGLHFISDYVSLYGFAAYGSSSYFDYKNYKIAYLTNPNTTSKGYRVESSSVLWSIMPVINMGKLPWLGNVFSMLTGYLNMDSNSDEFKPTHKAQLLFRDINIGQYLVVSLAAVTGSDWYNMDAKYTVYGGRFGLLGPGTFRPTVVIEGGYRSFFDVLADDLSYYENGPYGRLFLGFSLKSPYNDSLWNYCLMVESSPQNWSSPKIGILLTMTDKPKARIYFDSFDDAQAKRTRASISTRDLLYEVYHGGFGRSR